MIAKKNSNTLERANIAYLNEIFADVPLLQDEVNTLITLAEGESSTIINLVSAFKKAQAVRSGELFPLGHDSLKGYEVQYSNRKFIDED